MRRVSRSNVVIVPLLVGLEVMSIQACVKKKARSLQAVETGLSAEFGKVEAVTGALTLGQ